MVIGAVTDFANVLQRRVSTWRCHRVPQPDSLAACRSSDPDLDWSTSNRLEPTGRDRLGDGRQHGVGWGFRRHRHSVKAPWRTRRARLLLSTYGQSGDDRAEISGCRFWLRPVAWPHGIVALGHRPRAVPSRITQPRRSRSELDLVLCNVRRLDAP